MNVRICRASMDNKEKEKIKQIKNLKSNTAVYRSRTCMIITVFCKGSLNHIYAFIMIDKIKEVVKTLNNTKNSINHKAGVYKIIQNRGEGKKNRKLLQYKRSIYCIITDHKDKKEEVAEMLFESKGCAEQTVPKAEQEKCGV